MSHINQVVSVHACCNLYADEVPKENCKCKRRVSIKRANEMVKGGQADWIYRLNSRGFACRDDRSIATLGRIPRADIYIARVPGAPDIIRAYVYRDRKMRDWIEHFKPFPLALFIQDAGRYKP